MGDYSDLIGIHKLAGSRLEEGQKLVGLGG
ncbi:MAG: hypothetical protein ACI934_002192 [Pseudohongiellaceae bacterium]|jgi:hypothetical protein